ncbi:UMP kinase [candidate division WOR-3 bacterium]|nr:UMP kinase [candidate division WOR-3 bacterium]
MKNDSSHLKYRRIILKLSGEFFGNKIKTFDQAAINYTMGQIVSAREAGARIGIVVGAGNIIRGRDAGWMNKIDADMCGMVATVINSTLLYSALSKTDHDVRLSSALAVDGVAQRFNKFDDLEFYNSGGILIFAGGTGNPLFTTDTAAAVRAAEMCADVLIKGTKVAGVYSADPHKNKRATFYRELSYDQAIKKNLGVMDMAAFNLCREANIPIYVYNFSQHQLSDIITGKIVGTIISGGCDD